MQRNLARHLQNIAALMPTSSQHSSGTTKSVSVRLSPSIIWLFVKHAFFHGGDSPWEISTSQEDGFTGELQPQLRKY